MRNAREFDTIVVGGGQAGLAVSYFLKQWGQDHIVLEQAAQAANAWRNHRWDSFTLNTPNWQSQLQGGISSWKDADGFLTRDEIVSYFENYVEQNQLPVWYGVKVSAIKATGSGFTVETNAGKLCSEPSQSILAKAPIVENKRACHFAIRGTGQ